MRLPFQTAEVLAAKRQKVFQAEMVAMMQDLGILHPCEHHPNVLLHRTEIGDVTLAVSVGCNMVTLGRINATETDVAHAVISALESADDRCFSCVMDAHD
jgi:hypothetical protein